LIHLKENNLADARNEFLKAIALEPQMANAYSELGLVLCRMEKQDEAQEVLQLGLCPYVCGDGGIKSAIHNLLGDIYLSNDDAGRAAAEFRQAIQLAPDWDDPHRRLGYLYRNVGDPNAALEEFKTVQRLKPTEPDAFHGAGGVLRQMNRSNEAVDEYRKAIELNTTDAYAYIELAVCYKVLGQSELSAEYVEKALALGDTQIASIYDRACFWALAGNREKAIQLFAEALNSGDTTRRQARNDIDLALLHGDAEFAALVLEPDRQADFAVRTAAQGERLYS
jgi:Flp pilus assembly protein TadD